MTQTITRSVTHSTFTLERTYPVPPAKVFAAFKDPAKKRRWFVEGEGFTTQSYEPAFEVGAWERIRGTAPGNTPYTNDTMYFDIVPDERIVFSYHMSVGGAPISVSLTTIEFRPAGKGTLMVFTEQDAFLEGSDDGSSRKAGTEQLMDALGKELLRDAA
jgi:uncharacterized protein YndB with AHSA1/START domain